MIAPEHHPPKIYKYNDITVFLHSTDLPSQVCNEILNAGYAAIDTEAAGLRIGRDRLCLAQLSYKPREAHCVQIPPRADQTTSPNLCSVLSNTTVQKIFHFARFDVGILYKTYQVLCENVWCTRIASRICRTNTDSHSLLTLCHQILGIKLDKEMCQSDWTENVLNDTQLRYAANDVIYLRELQEKLIAKLKREERLYLAERAMTMIPPRVELDVAGWSEEDILAFRSRY
jgi:ribonuclease D